MNVYLIVGRDADDRLIVPKLGTGNTGAIVEGALTETIVAAGIDEDGNIVTLKLSASGELLS